MNTTNPKLGKRLSDAITEPLPKGRVSTADIRVGMLSSTDVGIICHKAKQTILSDLLAMIGEDETSEDEVENNLFYATRNGLRAELRQAIRSYVGVES